MRRTRKTRCSNVWHATGGVVAQISDLFPIVSSVLLKKVSYAGIIIQEFKTPDITIKAKKRKLENH